jgi:hypothetical protein
MGLKDVYKFESDFAAKVEAAFGKMMELAVGSVHEKTT